MKKTITLISVALLVLSITILAGCSKSSTTATNNPPSDPTSFAASQASRLAVNLSWGAAGADTFFLYASDDSAVWRNLGRTGSTTYNDSIIGANRKMFYGVKGENAYGASDTAFTSIWTLPAVYTFTTDDRSHFTASGLLGTPAPAWDLDALAGKVTLNNSGHTDGLVSVLTNYQMPNSGWFASKVKIGQWYGLGDTTNYAGFFMEQTPLDSVNNIVGVLFYPDSTLLGYWAAGNSHINRVATNPTVPLLTANTFHSIRLFHQGAFWKFYVDEILYWSGEIVNVASGQPLYEEWQFGQGTGASGQTYWVDDVANSSASPITISSTEPGTRNSLDLHATPHHK
jgi:hypothetical protein